MLPLLCIIFCIPFIGMKFAKKGTWQEDYLSTNVSKGILGYSALLIILHHLSQTLPDPGALIILKEAGVLFVGLFFFFSGYGLMVSKQTKPDYFQHFFRKRMSAILIPFAICNLIFFVRELVQGHIVGIGNTLSRLSGWILINTHMWYIVAITVLYILFYLVFRFVKREAVAATILTLLLIALTIGSLLLSHGEYWFQGEWWYNALLLFPVGIYYAIYRAQIHKFFHKFYLLSLLFFGAGTVLLYRATSYMLKTYSYWSEFSRRDGSMAYDDKFRCLSVQLPMILFFVIFVLLVTMKMQLKNPIMTYLGKISLELYLIHNLFIQGLPNIQLSILKNDLVFVLATLLLSIFVATVLHGLNHWLIGLVQKSKA